MVELRGAGRELEALRHTGRLLVAHWTRAECNWEATGLRCSRRFHYAARIWDGVKKSSALAEYSRLLG